jgi:diguanylate cyclase (GGDEF)-like protein/PAS domain S-box-containing protein
MAAETTQATLAELLRNHERFPSLFEGTDRPTALYDLAGNLIAANSAALVRLGHPLEELAGRRFEAFIEPAAKPALRRALVRACRGRSSRIPVRLHGVAGDEVIFEATLVPAVVDGVVTGVYASGDDAGAGRHLERSAREQSERTRSLDAPALSDALTGLPNRLMLRERLEATIAEAKRDGVSFALHFYDLDGFKRINDRYGHLRGDDVLKAVARRMATVSRRDHTLARIGGDRFVVLQPRVRDRAEAARVAHRLCDAVGEPFRIDGTEHRLSLSAGIAFFPQDAGDADALLRRADAALYRVKTRGRNAIAFADGRAV